MFDIIIPVGPKDMSIIQNQVSYTKANVVGYRNIYLISSDPNLTIEGCTTIDEKIFPFSINTVANVHGVNNMNGWYLQQLLKLYASFVIKDMLPTYLVIDADTFFFNKCSFIENGVCLYDYGIEYHESYFNHMTKLHPKLYKADKVNIKLSGICHHMMFEKKYIEEIFDIVETYHNKKFFEIFLEVVSDYEKPGASEYEIYFNYMMLYHKENIKIRKLNWTNVKSLDMKNYNYTKYDYVSYHWHMRK